LNNLLRCSIFIEALRGGETGTERNKTDRTQIVYIVTKQYHRERGLALARYKGLGNYIERRAQQFYKMLDRARTTASRRTRM